MGNGCGRSWNRCNDAVANKCEAFGVTTPRDHMSGTGDDAVVADRDRVSAGLRCAARGDGHDALRQRKTSAGQQPATKDAGLSSRNGSCVVANQAQDFESIEQGAARAANFFWKGDPWEPGLGECLPDLRCAAVGLGLLDG